MSDSQHQFPPDRWLLSTILKTPVHFLLFLLAFATLNIVSGKCFPVFFEWLILAELVCVAVCGIVGMIWNIIWWDQQPLPPPPKHCDKCGQLLPLFPSPKKEDECH